MKKIGKGYHVETQSRTSKNWIFVLLVNDGLMISSAEMVNIRVEFGTKFSSRMHYSNICFNVVVAIVDVAFCKKTTILFFFRYFNIIFISVFNILINPTIYIIFLNTSAILQ